MQLDFFPETLTQHTETQQVNSDIFNEITTKLEQANALLDNVHPDYIKENQSLTNEVQQLVSRVFGEEINMNFKGIDKNHPLKLEVEELIQEGINESKKKKELSQQYQELTTINGFNRYKRGQWKGNPHDTNRDVWTNPIEYLEIVYGKYLAKYNQEEQDYLFQYQLEKIDKRFKRTLTNFFQRNKNKEGWIYGELNHYLKPKENEYEEMTDKILQGFNSNRILEKLNYKKSLK